MSGPEDAARAVIASAVRDVIGRLAQLADSGSLEEYMTLFTADAEWVMPANPALGVSPQTRVGAADIRAGAEERRASGLQGPGTASRHVVHTISVDVRTASSAAAVAYWMFYVDTTTVPRLTSMGRYDDEYRLDGCSWRLARRVIEVG